MCSRCKMALLEGFSNDGINLLKTKRNLFYIRNQSIPRSKLFPSRFKNQSVNDA